MFFNYLMKSIRKKDWMTGTLFFALSFSFVGAITHQVRFLISETDSLPQHYFLHFPHLKPKVNEYALIWSPWYGNKVIKKIRGSAGDSVWFNAKNELFINQSKVGKPFDKALDGRALTAIKAQVIPEGYVFLTSEHPRSFDSRYQEFGLIPVYSLQGLVIPLG